MMEYSQPEQVSFSQPQLQAKAGIWIEAYKTIKQLYKILGIYLAYIVIQSPSNKLISYGLFGVVVLLIFVYGWLKYKNLSFYIDHEKEEFILKSGVFNKKNIVIKLDKIQQVLITQHLLQQFFKVYSVEISTPGSKETEVSIHAMKLSDATALKAKLLLGKKAHEGEENPEDETTTDAPDIHQIKLSNATIFKVAITSRYGQSLAVIIGSVTALYNTISDWMGLNDLDQEITNPDNWQIFLKNSFLLTALVLLIWILFNLFTGFLRFYNYKINFTADAIQVRFGAIKTNNAIIYAQKVQVFTVIQNFFQKKMNLSRVVFEQASSNFAADKKATIEIPGCTTDQQKEFEHYVFKTSPDAEAHILRPNKRKLLLHFYLWMALPTILLVVFFKSLPIYVIYLFPLWLLVVGILNYYNYKHSRMIINSHYIVLQSGAWNITTKKMETYKIQGVKITQRLWHRRAGIAHVTLLTAANNLRFSFVRLEEINPFINKWLYDAEVSDKSWM